MRWLRIGVLVLAGCAGRGEQGTSGSATSGASDQCATSDVGMTAGGTTGNFGCHCGYNYSCGDGSHCGAGCGSSPLADGGELTVCTCSYRDGHRVDVGADATCCGGAKARCGFTDPAP